VRRTWCRHDDVAFDRQPVSDGDTLDLGGLRVQVVATPGHTDHHVAYVVRAVSDDPDAAGPCRPVAVFTGGSLLYGSVGRTDLVDPGRTEELTRAQFRSARRLAGLLDDNAAVYPTHGFGSFCSSGSAGAGEDSTVGRERASNDVLTEPDEDAFVERLVAGLTAFPSYYAHMGARNRQGAGPADLSAPSPVDAEQLRGRVAAGEWVVDLRDRVAYAAEHLRGSVGIELGEQFTTYLGWLVPWGTPITLIGDDPQQVADAQRQLVRIGIDRPAGAAVGTPAQLADGEPTAATRGQASSTWSRTPVRVGPPAPSSTCVATTSAPPATSPAPCTSRCTRCCSGSTTFLAVPCGCTAPPGTAPRSPPACWTAPGTAWCCSTVTTPTPSASTGPPADRAYGQGLPWRCRQALPRPLRVLRKARTVTGNHGREGRSLRTGPPPCAPRLGQPSYWKIHRPKSRSLAATYSCPPCSNTSTPQKLLPSWSM